MHKEAAIISDQPDAACLLLCGQARQVIPATND